MSLLFQLGDVTVPVLAGVDQLAHRYEPIGGESIFRASTGRGVKQMTWSKTRITISGAGWVPSGLQGLDYSRSMILRCVAPLSLNTSGAAVVLPAKRRSDPGHQPFAIALLKNGTLPTGLELVGDVATPAPIPGAVGYSVCWYPEFEVWAMRPQQAGERTTAAHSWELTAEEV